MLCMYTKLENHYCKGQFLCTSGGKNQFVVGGEVTTNANIEEESKELCGEILEERGKQLLLFW